jgi:hypothetical protein
MSADRILWAARLPTLVIDGLTAKSEHLAISQWIER